jgi:hypothetical protein
MKKNFYSQSFAELPVWIRKILVVMVFIGWVFLFLFLQVPAIDWRDTFRPVSLVPQDPFSVKTFINLPWAAILLYPLHFFNENLGMAINSSLNLMVIGALILSRKGSLFSLALTLTSLPFLSLIANGSIEWIPALGFLLQNSWGVILLLTKPQSGILASLAWFLSARKKWLFLLPGLAVVVFSFLAWKNWPADMVANLLYMDAIQRGLFSVNIAPWPWAIPVGIGLVFYILLKKKANSELLGALATCCLVPYFVPHSLTIPFALLSVSHRRWAIVAWLFLWGFQLATHWSAFLQIIGIQ